MNSNGNLSAESKIQVQGLNLFYGNQQALQSINMTIPEKQITALIGPSGCGKSSFLRCLNRMNDLLPHTRITGSVSVNGKNIYDSDVNEVAVRKKIGMVFQQPNPFPKSVYDNVAYAPLKHGLVKRGSQCDVMVESALRRAGLFEEVKDKLHQPGTSLSGGQQQRLCIARAIANQPDIILMDEPTSALDPISTQIIEKLMLELKRDFTIVIVTHNMQQARRIADRTAHFHLGRLIEIADTRTIFEQPQDDLTRDYVGGVYG